MMNFSPTARSGRLPAFAALLLILLASGCINQPRIVTPEPPPVPEDGKPIPETNTAVLSNNTQVIAKTGFGRIKIEAGPGMRRVFTWNGLRRGVVLEPRKEGFANGGKGIYFTGKPPVWEPANGVTKVEVEEGHRRFKTADDALIWMQIRRPYFTYNNSGLAVGWRRVDDTLEAEVWQFYIGGETPSTMPDADDSSISVGPLKVQPQKMQPVWLYPDGHTQPASQAEIAAAARTSAARKAGTATQQNWFERNIASPLAGAFGGKSDKADANSNAAPATEQADASADANKAAGDAETGTETNPDTQPAADDGDDAGANADNGEDGGDFPETTSADNDEQDDG